MRIHIQSGHVGGGADRLGGTILRYDLCSSASNKLTKRGQCSYYCSSAAHQRCPRWVCDLVYAEPAADFARVPKS